MVSHTFFLRYQCRCRHSLQVVRNCIHQLFIDVCTFLGLSCILDDPLARTIIIFDIFVNTFVLLRTCASSFFGNVYTVKTLIMYLHTLVFTIQKLEVLCILCNFLGHFVIFSNSMDTSLIEYNYVHTCSYVECQMSFHIYNFENNHHIHSQFCCHMHSQFLPISCPY